MKAKLRAWLIELVREAIRSERTLEHKKIDVSVFAHPEDKLSRPMKTESAPIVIAPSFEQLQAEALAAQEKFYEPERA